MKVSAGCPIFNDIPFIIDLANHKLGPLPSFLMPITLIHSEKCEYGRTDLFEIFLKGKFDDIFSSMTSCKIVKKEDRENILIAETLILISIGSKLNENSLKYWLEAIFR